MSGNAVRSEVPFFSIVVPTFNSERTLGRCLDSLLNQTWEQWEIVVVDGSSSDKTVEIIESYAAISMRMKWISEPDKGIYDAMNKGIKIAEGSWLLFLGSDDALYGENILCEVAEQIAFNPASKFLFGDVYTSQGTVQKFDYFSFERLVQHNICHQAIFYHSSLFEGTRYDYRLRLLADWDFNLKVFKKENHPIYIDKIISVYNMDGASANWVAGQEYRDHFRNKNYLIKKYRGTLALYRYLLRKQIQKAKQRVYRALNVMVQL